MDKLDKIFEMQKALNDDIIERRQLEKVTSQEWIQKHMIAMFCEVAEVLEETNYKWWKNEKEIDSSKLKEELVDVLHFFVSMCLNAGLSSEELFDIYMQKNNENFLRQQGKSKKKGYCVNEHETK